MTDTTARAVPTFDERRQAWAQHGITKPVIIERTWRGMHPITPEVFQADMLYVAQLCAHEYEWRGTDREGRPLVVVWWVGPRAGQLFSAYEITGRSTWRYAHTGWSAHSSGAGARTYWLACYVAGKQVRTYDNGQGRLIRFKSYESATRKAAQLNKADGIASGEGE